MPKATSVEHLKDNLDVNFKISSGDMKKLIELDKIENYGDYSFFPVFSGKLKGVNMKNIIVISSSLREGSNSEILAKAF